MNRAALYNQITKKQSYLCVGLDTDIHKIPQFLLEYNDPIFEFNKRIIDATQDLVIAYKPNLAFYEALGIEGLQSLKKTIDYIPDDILVIADAKRGDIGNTSKMYAKSFFEYYGADALTIAPYMGKDSIEPFTSFKDKWTIILGLTSNIGSQDFQHQQLSSGESLYKFCMKKCTEYGSPEQLMFVVGATQAKYIKEIREMLPDYFFLVPGVGAQGGSLSEVSKVGMNDHCGLIVNSSRGIIYAAHDETFADAARLKAQTLQQEMATFL